MFRKGDKVICEDSKDVEELLTLNKVYTVLNVEHLGYIRVESDKPDMQFNGWFSWYRFRLVDEKELT